MIGGYAFGAGMKLFLPEHGSFRFVAGTILLTAVVADIAKPLWSAAKTAWNTNDSDQLVTAQKQFGKSMGDFSWDSLIGLGTAKAGDVSTSWAVRKVAEEVAGPGGYRAFEAWKMKQLEGRTGTVGQFVAPISEGLSRLTRRTREYLAPQPFDREMSPQEIVIALQEAVKHLHEQTRNLMYKSRDFSSYLDGLTGEGPAKERPVVRLPNLAVENQKISAIMRRTPPSEPPMTEEILPDLHSMGRPGVKAGRPISPERSTFPKAPGSPDISPIPEMEGDAHSLRKPDPPKDPPKDLPKGKDSPGSPQPDPKEGDKTAPPAKDTTGGETTDKPKTAPVGGDKTPPIDEKAGRDKPVYKTSTTPAEELDPKGTALIAETIRTERAKWAISEEDEKKNIPSPAAMADFRDGLAAPVKTVSDPARSGRMLEPEFDKSAEDILKLIDSELRDIEGMKEAGALLQWHSLAGSQIILQVKNALALNLLAKEILGTFLGQMRKLGVTDNLLEGQVHSVSAISNDRGSGNFTISAIADLLRRAVTIFPRDQSSLIAVLGPINYHENLGHNHVFPMIALIARHLLKDPLKDAINDEYRNGVLKAAVQEAFTKNNIQDVDVKVGDQTMKKSELFFKALLDQASENTPDKLGTAAGVFGSPLTLGVLLQSLRPDYLLETRNVFGKEFDLFEPHGFDRWRLKLTAATMRHLGDGDKLVNEYANAFDNFADKGSRPGDFYTFASVDKKGEIVRIKQSEWDAIIPEIVKTQFDTPMPSLNTKSGMKTLKELFPNFVSDFHKVHGLAEKIADAVTKGDTKLEGFDGESFRNQYTIGNTFNANMLAWAKTRARGVDPTQALEAINNIWEPIRDLYLEKNPHDVPLTQPVMDRLRAQPIRTVARGIARTTGEAVGALPSLANRISDRSVSIGGVAGSIYVPELLGLDRQTKEMLDQAGVNKPTSK
jgi:hypothetical protein